MMQKLKDGEYYDLKVNCDDQVVKSNGALLAGVSPVLKEMISSSYLQNSVIYLKDAEAGTFSRFLDHCFFGEVETFNDQTALNLLQFAKSYKVEDLENKCREFLIGNISEHNAVSLLRYSKLLN